MRAYGRVDSGSGGQRWMVEQTDAQGNSDRVYITALLQCLKLNLGESPFFAFAGIPAEESVIQQVFPDYYVSVIQQLFAPFFVSLIITGRSGTVTPIYDVNVITHRGTKLSASVQIGQ